MAILLLLNKPFGVLSQFEDNEGRNTLKTYITRPNFYPAGRLDQDSEGLLLLTDEGSLQHRIAHPSQKLSKTYWVQVEGAISDDALEALRKGVVLNDGPTRPAKAKQIPEPAVWVRTPPIRFRKNDITSWIELSINEGRNRQVRRMTASVGFPTLRLIRAAIGPWNLGTLQPGESREEQVNLPASTPKPTAKPNRKSPRRRK